jgi:VCBS repeat-containing protein
MPPSVDTPKPESDPPPASPPTQSSPKASESIAAQDPSPFPAASTLRVAKLDTTSTAAPLDATQRHTSALQGSTIDTDQAGAQPDSMRMTTLTAVTQPPAPAATDPMTAFRTVHATVIATATKLVEATLAFLATRTPGTPPESPLTWTLLAIVRRQFFNETPSITPTVSAPDALGNITISLSETDADGDQLVYSATDGNKGTITLNADGHSFTYTPDAGQTGIDTVAITATDATNDHIHGVSGLINALSFGLLGDSGHTAATTATVTLNTPPTLTATPGTPDQTDGKVTVTVVTTDPDHNPLTLSLTPPAAGTGTVSTPTLIDAATGTYTVVYTPATRPATPHRPTPPPLHRNPTASPSASATATARRSPAPSRSPSPPTTTHPPSRRSPPLPTCSGRSPALWCSPTATTTP